MHGELLLVLLLAYVHVAAVPFTGGGSLLGGATLAGALTGAATSATVAGIVGGIAGGVISKKEKRTQMKL